MSRHFHLATVISAAFMVVVGYLAHVEAQHVAITPGYHADVIAGVIDAPFRYRVLVPLLAQAVVGAMPSLPLVVVYAAIGAGSLLAFVVGLYALLCDHASRDAALIGTLFVCCALHVMFVWWNGGSQATAVEAALVVWSLRWVTRIESKGECDAQNSTART